MTNLWVPRGPAAPARPPLLPPARDRRCPDGPTFRYVETQPAIHPTTKHFIGVLRRWHSAKTGLHVQATVEPTPLGDLVCLHVAVGHPTQDLTQRQIRQVIRTFYGAAPAAVWQLFSATDGPHTVHLWGVPGPPTDDPPPTAAEQTEELRHAAEV